MTLSDKQALFLQLTIRLFYYVEKRHKDLRIRYGDAYDRPGSNTGRKSRSNHRRRLAIDLILDKWDPVKRKWVYQTKTESYRALGLYWQRLHPLCEWGGESREGEPRHDGNHFSLNHNGQW